jgi:ubiquinone biosynthesis protein
MRDAGEGATSIGRMLADLPQALTQAQTTAVALADMAKNGVRLDDASAKALARESARKGRWQRAGIWLGALSLAALAAMQVLERLGQ